MKGEFEMNEMKMYILTLVGAAGGGIAAWFGGWDVGLQVLIGCMAVDFAMGLAVAFVWRKSPKTESGAASSGAGFKGICKKTAMLLIVAVAHMADMALGTTFLRDAVVIAYIANEIISITENAGLMGVPLPAALTRAIDLLTKKSEQEEAQHGDSGAGN